MDSRDQAKSLILRLVAAAGEGGLEGRTRLYKAFYFAHLYYFHETGLPLTAWNVVNMPEGPGVDRGPALIEEMEESGLLVAEPIYVGPFVSERYRVGPRFDPAQYDVQLPGYEQAVESAWSYVRPRTAAELSAETHEFSRSWKETRPGEPLDMVLDMLTDEELADLARTRKQAEGSLRAVWNA